jgi:hypothetical protein
VPHFDDRYIHSQQDWTSVLYPQLRDFLVRAARDKPQFRLALDAHVTLAFAAGSVLDIKSGRRVEIEQRSLERRIWSADDANPNPAWPHLSWEWTEIDPAASNVAVAVGLTHDIAPAVRQHIEGLAGIKGVLVGRPSEGASARAVTCGAHATLLAEAVVAEARTRRAGGHLHLFVAGPNAFAFFLGQRRVALGPITLYEFDFEGSRTGGYAPSLCLPIVPAGHAGLS